MTSTRHLLSIAGFVLLTVLLTGCGDGVLWNSPYPPGAAGESVYYSSFEERPKHLDPARSYSSNEWAFISQIYEPPLQYHFLKRPYALTPLTSDGMPLVTAYGAAGEVLPAGTSPDKVAYTDYEVRIRQGIRFQDHPAFARRGDGSYRWWPLAPGALDERYTLADFDAVGTRELVAEDYVYQVKRLAFTPNHSPIGGLMAEYIEGFAEFKAEMDTLYAEAREQADGEDFWFDLRPHAMAGVEVVDRYTFRIRLKGTYPQFIYWLAMNFFAPMPWEAERFYAQPGMKARNINLHWYPVGTGPYVLAENNPNLRMVLARNPNFRGETYPSDGSEADRREGRLVDAGRAMPFIDRAVYSLEKEAIPRWNKFLQGYYDGSGISSDSFDQAVQIGSGGEPRLTEAMAEKDIRLNTAVSTSIYYTSFNMLDPVTGGSSERARLLRQAISIAIDMEEYISIFSNGRGVAAQGPLPPGIFGYVEGEQGINPYMYDWVDGRPQRKSIGHARELLVQAGYAGGRDPETGGPLVLNLDTPAAGPDSKAMLNWYVKQLRKLGIELVIRATDYNRFQEKMLKGNAQMFSWGWNADYPDPENFLFLLYGPNGKSQHHGENAANFQNDEYDALFGRMKNMANGPERQEVIDRMVEILRYQAPWVSGFYPKSFGLHHAWYGNAYPHLMANNTLKYKKVDGGTREQRQAEWNQPVVWPVVLLGIVLLLSVLPAVRGFRQRERSTAR